MPLRRIDLQQGSSPQRRAAIGDVVHRAICDVLGVPPGDRFQIISEHATDGFVHTQGDLGVRYSQQLVIVQILVEVAKENCSFGNGQAQYAA